MLVLQDDDNAFRCTVEAGAKAVQGLEETSTATR
jgi:hypothetical protein